MTDDPSNPHARASTPPPPAGGFGAQDGNAAAGAHPLPPPPPVAAPSNGMPTWVIALLASVFGGVFVIGILAALAIHGMNKFIRASKTAEARNSVGMLSKDAIAAFEASEGALGTATGKRDICAGATAPVPQSIALVAGKKYLSEPSEWERDAESKRGFSCLKFRMEYPQYYQYDYAADGKSFTAIARGDLNGDGVASEFKLGGHLEGDTLVTDARIQETNPEE